MPNSRLPWALTRSVFFDVAIGLAIFAVLGLAIAADNSTPGPSVWDVLGITPTHPGRWLALLAMAIIFAVVYAFNIALARHLLRTHGLDTGTGPGPGTGFATRGFLHDPAVPRPVANPLAQRRGMRHSQRT